MRMGSWSHALVLGLALAGSAGIVVTVAPVPAFAQHPAGMPIVSTSLLRFEAAVSWASVAPRWRAQRGGWAAAVSNARTPQQLAVQVLALETAMGWSAVQPSWRQERPAWVARVRAASTTAEVARLLLALENTTRWEAVAAAWRTDRGAWIAALQGVAGG